MRVLGVLARFSPVVLAAACSSNESSGPPPAADAGTNEAASIGADEVRQSGKIVRARATDVAVENATVAVAGKSATTSATGAYEIAVPKDRPYQMKVTADGFFDLLEQEWIAKSDLALGDTQMLTSGLANLVAALLSPPRDPAKGLLVVSIRPRPPCASEEGATLVVTPAGQAKITYVAGGIPDGSQASAKAGEAFSAIVYDVDPDVTLEVKVDSPTCAELAFPVESDGVVYTGKHHTVPGDAFSFMRVFLGPTKAADGGT